MKPKVGILSVGRLSNIIMEQVGKMNLQVNFMFHEISIDEDIALSKEINSADVILSSGFRAHIAIQKIDKPIINMEISSYDIMLALSNAVQYDEKPVIITYQNNYSKLNKIRNILKIDIVQDSYSRLEDIEEIILKHKQLGRRCIIGSGLVCSLAEKHNLIAVFVFPLESIRNYIQIASDMAIAICKEVSNNKQLSSVVNYANRGIVFTDDKGKISICNPIAETFFQLSLEKIIGKRIQSFFSNNEFKNILDIKESEINIFSKINGKEYVINAIPINHKAKLLNMLFFIDDIYSVQKAEQHIRENLAQKGFAAKHSFHNYNSYSRNFRSLILTSKKFARSDESIVILGETGTGKEVLAQSIHNYSKRSKKAFVAVNCSAINTNLLESELFGYDEGAFTGAKKGGKKGLFEMAHLGTIFLDEIGEMDSSLQSKLLRVIQEREVMHVGGTKMIPFDARIIVATNKNLWDLVQNNNFREDLYYRLNVLELNLMPLRDRSEDIYPLFINFLGKYAPQLIYILKPISTDITRLLCSYTWPGNVRELENYTKMIIASIETHATMKNIYGLMVDTLQLKIIRVKSEPSKVELSNSFDITYHDQEIREIYSALNKTNGNQTKAAKMLGISRVTLWRKLKKYHEKNNKED